MRSPPPPRRRTLAPRSEREEGEGTNGVALRESGTPFKAHTEGGFYEKDSSASLRPRGGGWPRRLRLRHQQHWYRRAAGLGPDAHLRDAGRRPDAGSRPR